MSSKRDGFRIIAYCSILVIYSTFMVDKVVNNKRKLLVKLPSYHAVTSTAIAEPPFPPRLLQPSDHTVQPILPTATSPHHLNNKTNLFMHQFEEIFTNPEAYSTFVAVVVRNGDVYCRKGQTIISRARYYIQMLQRGLRDRRRIRSSYPYEIPVLIKHDDSNGCYPAKKYDKYEFPRLTWSLPLDNKGGWCAVSGMPSYKTWRDSSKRRDDEQYWTNRFDVNDEVYPWDTKLNMAVWRGATTFNKGLYGHLDFNDLPRAKLVYKSKESLMIDAAFHKLVGKYEDETQTPSHVRELMNESIPLDEMMKYKAIIDIDGNTWSARFNSLLCSNSVVIKIQPDFIEPSYYELDPYVHYVPATIENLTEAVEYAMDSKHEKEMVQIVRNANDWCKSSMTAAALADAAAVSLENYEKLLTKYDASWKERSSSILLNANDLVPCNV